MDSNRTIEKIQKLAEKKKSAKIIKFLGAAESEVVVAALNALATVKDEDSVNSIAGMIDSNAPEVRAAAAKALGEIGTEYAKTYLQHRAAKEQDEKVKAAIKDALHTIAERK
ncbi:MAG: HEAT repeat domain-containing protein [Acetatifactor sp.]